MRIAIVFNPGSGSRAAHNALSDVVAALASHSHTLTVIDCDRQPDFERELRLIASTTERLIVIGGDGTLSSAINAILVSDNPALPVAFVPTGRGKDTARSLPSWSASELTEGRFEHATSKPTDVIKITLRSGIERYSINLSSIGVGAHAAAVAGKLPRVLGSLSYVLGAVRGFIPIHPFKASITIDGTAHSADNALLIAACNGKGFGGGIYLAPEAEQDDGFLDIVVISNANLGDLALQLGKLKSGTPFDHPAITRWKTRAVEIDPVNTRYYEADGEALSSQPVRYEVVPDALNLDYFMTSNLKRTSEQWRSILRKNQIRPTKSMGQNFLTETAVVEEIVEIAEIGSGDLVIEIGPGMGILSREIIASGADLIAVELDRDLANLLRKDLADHESFTLIEQDARYLNTAELTANRPYQVVANLPYSVATVIMRNLMESSHPPTRMTVMVQREVAERMTAEPGSMSLLGLATDLYSDANIAMIVPPDVFLPPPKVESAVVQMDTRLELRGTAAMRERMFELATMAFQRKRKTLSNGLSMGLGRPKSELDAVLNDVEIDPMKRPQMLSVDDWLIAEALP